MLSVAEGGGGSKGRQMAQQEEEQEPTNPYERNRFLNMARLKAAMSMIVKPALDNLKAAMPAKEIKRQVARQYVRRPVGPARRSTRIGDAPAVQYNVDQIYSTLQGLEKRYKRANMNSRRLIRGDPTRTRRSNDNGWNAYMGIAKASAADEARDDAEAKVAALASEGKVANVKLMSDSQVSGGFWCQLPRPFALAFNLSSKRPVALNYEGRSWPVVLLPKDSSAGLSGGWRTFAIDQVIYPNDAVVFEKVDEDNINAHIYRAYDYDPNFVAASAPEDVVSDQEEMLEGAEEKQEEGEEEEAEEEPQQKRSRKRARCAAEPAGEDEAGEEEEVKEIVAPKRGRGRKPKPTSERAPCKVPGAKVPAKANTKLVAKCGRTKGQQVQVQEQEDTTTTMQVKKKKARSPKEKKKKTDTSDVDSLYVKHINTYVGRPRRA